MQPTKRILNRWAMVGVLLSGCAVPASHSRGEVPTCERVPAEHARHAELEALTRQLEEREADVARLRAALDEREERAFYEKAQSLGIVDAVKATKLPERQQRRIAVAIVREAALNQVDPLLVVAVIRIESAFNNYAVSPVGAMGLMQVMPATGQWLVERRGGALGRTSNLFDSELNIELGTAYLAELIERFGKVDEALAAYNAGPTGAKKILAKRASRVRFMAGYPTKVLGEFRKLEREAEERMARSEQDEPLPDGRG